MLQVSRRLITCSKSGGDCVQLRAKNGLLFWIMPETACGPALSKIRAWSLKGRGRRGRPKVRRSHRVARSAVRCIEPPANVRAAVYPVPDGSTREVEEIGGELREVTQADRLQRLRRWPLRTLLTGRETREQLEEIRRARGYKAGWVWHTLQSQRTAMLGERVAQ